MTTAKKSPITSWLEVSHPAIFSAYVMIMAFSTYFCMYAFRKPFTAGTYDGYLFFGLDYKTIIVISQIIGYCLSKYIGIKVCSEVTRAQRAWTLIILILIAEIALLFFAVLPPNLKVIAIFCNGLPLGMVWGIACLYLEGRKLSQLLFVGLSCSYIMSSGIVKDVGRWLMASHNVTEFWMPVTTGILFLPFFCLAVWMLNQIPDPTEEEVKLQVKRQPMYHADRYKFFTTYLPGLIMLLIAYFFITAFRDIRDNYGQDIFVTMGYGEVPAIFTSTEVPIGFGIMFVYAALSFVRGTNTGFITLYAIMIFGTALTGISTLLFQFNLINGIWWMILIGFGAYLAYVPYASILFDKTIASTHFVGTAVFASYIMDAIGYTGSVSIQLYKVFSTYDLSYFDIIINLSYAIAIGGSILQLFSLIYFLKKSNEPVPEPDSAAA